MILKNYHQNLLLFCRNPSFLLNMITYLAATFYRKKKQYNNGIQKNGQNRLRAQCAFLWLLGDFC
jgi:hypothetical protein